MVMFHNGIVIEVEYQRRKLRPKNFKEIYEENIGWMDQDNRLCLAAQCGLITPIRLTPT